MSFSQDWWYNFEGTEELSEGLIWYSAFCCCITYSNQAWAEDATKGLSDHVSYTCSAVPGTQVGDFVGEAGNMETCLIPDSAWVPVKHPGGGKRLLLPTLGSSWVLWIMFWSSSFTWVYLINYCSRQKSGPLFLPAKTRALQFLMRVVLTHDCFRPTNRWFLAHSPLPFPVFSSPFALFIMRLWRLV